MSALPSPRDTDLHRAFDNFNEVSLQLIHAYRDLEIRHQELTAELSDTKTKRFLELAEKEQLAARLDLLLETLPVGVLVLNKAGLILEYNPAAVELLDQALDGMHWRQILDHVLAKGYREDLAHIEINGKNLHITNRPIAGSSEEIILIADVSEPLSQLEFVKRKERLALLGETVASIAHDVRTPLAAAVLHVSNMEKCLKMNGSFSLKTLDKLRFCLKNVESTVNNMLLFAKGKEDRFESMAAMHFMKKLSGDLIHSFPHVAIRVNVDPQIDQAALQVNYIAVLNSIKNLMLNAAQVSQKPKVSIRASVFEHCLRLFIQDNGPGIANELKEQIFDPFFSTRKNGTGLGLAIVRSTIDAHQGRVSVVDSDVGAAFVIDLPLGGSQASIAEQNFCELKEEART